jgi:hypothetical protein
MAFRAFEIFCLHGARTRFYDSAAMSCALPAGIKNSFAAAQKYLRKTTAQALRIPFT